MTGAVKWAAGPDGVAHAYRARSRSRALCDWPRLPARQERPFREFCAECRLRLGLLPLGTAPSKEAEPR
jgi:hypothetical protein